MAMLSLLVLCLSILGFTAWAIVSDWGQAGLNNAGSSRIQRSVVCLQFRHRQQWQRLRVASPPIPPTAIPTYNLTLGFAMLIGRFLMIIPIMALAGSLVKKKISPPGAGTFPVQGGTFIVLLIGTVGLGGSAEFPPRPRPRTHRGTLPDRSGLLVLTF